MGQRLVITVRKEQEKKEKIYFHWSGYSVSALEETRSLLKDIDTKEENIKKLQLNIIRACESMGGGIDGGAGSEEFSYVCNIFPNVSFKEDPNRNCGLVALSENDMEKIQLWSNGNIVIDLDYNRIYNSVLHEYHSLEEYEAETGQSADEVYCCESDIDITDFRMEYIDEVIDFIDVVIRAGGIAKNCGTYIDFIY
mgnify:FL=1